GVRYSGMTQRRDAMFQDITVAQLDHMLLSTIPMEANLYRAVRAMVPSVKAVRVPAPFTCYVSIEQRLIGQAKNAILAVLGADLYVKRVVVVDHDVNIFDDRQVTWAIATRCQPDRDITIVTNARGSDLDPSTKEDGYSGRGGGNATPTRSLAGYPPRRRVPPEVWKRLDLKECVEEGAWAAAGSARAVAGRDRARLREFRGPARGQRAQAGRALRARVERRR